MQVSCEIRHLKCRARRRYYTARDWRDATSTVKVVVKYVNLSRTYNSEGTLREQF